MKRGRRKAKLKASLVSLSRAFFIAPLAALSLSGCEDVSSLFDSTEEQEQSQKQQETAPSSAETASDPLLVAEDADGVTPMAERIATIGLLNKRNNVSKDLLMRPGETVEEGQVIVRLEACERTAPYEFPEETGAFVQLDVLERGQDEHSRVFSGWLFKENPSLNVVEHPVYDVWVKDCAMRFPGEPPLEAPSVPSDEEAGEE